MLVHDLQEYYLKLEDYVNVQVYFSVPEWYLSCKSENCPRRDQWCITLKYSVNCERAHTAVLYLAGEH
jgi:hypothetical protein